MEEKKSGAAKGLGIAGLVIGIIGLIVSIIPLIGVFAMYIGGLALILSVIGLILAIQKKAGKGLVIAALIVSFLGTAIGYWQYSKISKAVEDGVEQFQKDLENTNQ